jgi:CBS domain-containing protein
MRQALERMEYHRYTAVPLLDDEGHYAGTLTEGDLLWSMKDAGRSFDETEHVPLASVPRRTANAAVQIDAEIEQLLTLDRSLTEKEHERNGEVLGPNVGGLTNDAWPVPQAVRFRTHQTRR